MSANPPSASLPKTIGLFSLIIFGIGDMLGAGIYALIGVSAGLLGNMVWVGFLVSCVAAVLTGLSYANIGARYPKSAGASFVVHRAFKSPYLAYLVGLAVFASGLTSMAAASRAFARYSKEWVPLIPETFIAIAFLLILALIVCRGLKESAGINLLCTAIEAGGLIFIIAIGLKHWGDVDLFDATSQQNPTGSISAFLLLQGAALTFYAFMGFEDMLNLSEEVKDVERVFPRALIVALIVTSLIYIGVSITAVSVVPSVTLASIEGPAPLVKVVEKAAPWFNSLWFSFISLFAITNTALLNFIMASRISYGMANQGLLPALFSTLTPKRGSPLRAIIAVFLLSSLLVLAAELADLAAATSLLLLVVFIVVNVALIRLKFLKDERRSSFEISVIIPFLATLLCLGVVSVRVFTGTPTAVFIALGILVGITILYFGSLYGRNAHALPQ